ncbi:bifunctional 2-C-methyl-D-erythritol 4-phosphate cytidylyltransferase/2-C-methyl-D-erythritol 2,4-cyclodiphosphate synthase [Stakelama sediminis]|uniref:Bifunctional enzyme IspD/IspF n=1 Tax=Stakelama sediminis TaxID=463200 RepID=A0A840YZ74_9SPHN|nr:bifunctional 2-C-methyl-D-erythritol 4-phosphate cytidylyltransferase/2-C-methyl-D-erythritol 2,4-cyclodiphosphate synthase [Stakelama sediminis]MBB5718802.1 2-C-methyl-D-erythritol 4-phosphate cytidylyltransferase/2-C-methyl-D-erythritol 2,4-cyclodiphosphate synthase [Stakelama sediminis]
MISTETIALIVAAGRGLRTGDTLPKQFASVAGQPMLRHSYDAFCAHPGVDRVVVVIGDGQQAMFQEALPGIEPVIGGAARRDSVRAGLEHIASTGGCARVLIHDAARPFLPSAVIDRLLAALETHSGCVPVLRMADTLARSTGTLGDVVPRDDLVRVQTPQAFDFATVLAAHRTWPEDREATDDAQMVRAHGADVVMVEGDSRLEKITFASDLADARGKTGEITMISRSAMGFDVHRLVDGEDLWLGGVQIPHDKGLSGHSDADVALHAMTDALLGTIGAGDIGTHFPPSDPQWRGAASHKFVEHAVNLIEQQHGRIDFIDLTLICEAPKIGPYRDAMRDRIAALLRVKPAKVSIKATTTERLGFAGRGEGIAAQAVATVRIPEDQA